MKNEKSYTINKKKGNEFYERDNFKSKWYDVWRLRE